MGRRRDAPSRSPDSPRRKRRTCSPSRSPPPRWQSPSLRDRRDRDAGRHRSRDRGARSRRSPSEDCHGGRQRGGQPHGRDGEREFKRRRSEDRERGVRSDAREAPLEVNSIIRGVVRSIKAFGVFVTLGGHRRDGMVHITQVSEDVNFTRDDEDADKITALEYFCPMGSQVWVKLMEVQGDGRGGMKISCSMKAVDQETGKDLDPTNSLASKPRGGCGGGGGPGNPNPPEIGSVHKASVVSIRPFGAFVRLEGFQSNGLVHVSQVSDHMEMDKEDSDEAKVAALGQVLAMGETVWVKVVDIKDAMPGDDRGPKIGCSIKLVKGIEVPILQVSQRDGVDLDPHGLQYKPRQNDGEFGQRKAVGSDVGKVQQGTVDWGHLNADRVNMDPKYAQYDLVGATAEEVAPPRDAYGAGNLPPPPSAGLKKQQKLQKTGVSTVEEAMAILQQHGKKSKHRTKKDKKSKKEKKAQKTKKERKKSKQGSPTTSSGS